jgi:hypothetical protein
VTAIAAHTIVAQMVAQRTIASEMLFDAGYRAVLEHLRRVPDLPGIIVAIAST